MTLKCRALVKLCISPLQKRPQWTAEIMWHEIVDLVLPTYQRIGEKTTSLFPLHFPIFFRWTNAKSNWSPVSHFDSTPPSNSQAVWSSKLCFGTDLMETKALIHREGLKYFFSNTCRTTFEARTDLNEKIVTKMPLGSPLKCGCVRGVFFPPREFQWLLFHSYLESNQSWPWDTRVLWKA